MADTLQFDLVSPERNMASGAASQVMAPGAEGDFTAMPGHAPFITTLRPGVVEATIDGAPQRFAVFGGLVEVGPDRCAILADDATPYDQFDASTLDGRIAEAEEQLAKSPAGDTLRRAQFLNDLRAMKMLHGR